MLIWTFSIYFSVESPLKIYERKLRTPCIYTLKERFSENFFVQLHMRIPYLLTFTSTVWGKDLLDEGKLRKKDEISSIRSPRASITSCRANYMQHNLEVNERTRELFQNVWCYVSHKIIKLYQYIVMYIQTDYSEIVCTHFEQKIAHIFSKINHVKTFQTCFSSFSQSIPNIFVIDNLMDTI